MTRLKAYGLTPTIGAELTGLDFSEPLSQANYDAVYDALIEHQVIFFRDQHLTPEAHLNFVKSFGEPEPPHPVYPHVEGYAQVMLLENGPENPPDTDVWHTDVTFRADPPFASILYSRVIPPVGGDTLWTNLTAAYVALPDGIKADIAELRAVHDLSDFRNNFTVGEPDGAATRLNEAHQRFGSAIHPLVKHHPVTDNPILFVNPGFTVHVVGMTSAASRRLLSYLFDHMNQPEFQVRFKWTENTIAMWDNRCTMHFAIGDYLPHRRKMHRVTVINDRRAENRAEMTEGSKHTSSLSSG
ncbi:MAG: TauD/TfdA family dioxygenase [Alphaproteobacteria bacterium]|jgi:taurine dioxygenase